MPLKFSAGVKVTNPVVGFIVHSPSPGTVKVLPSADNVDPDGGFTKVTLVTSKPVSSVSFVNTFMVTGVSSEVFNASFDTSGASFTSAKLTVTIEDLKCGVFEIDEINLSGPPDVVTIRGMATGIVNSLRTKKSDAHESKTLKQIAEKVLPALQQNKYIIIHIVDYDGSSNFKFGENIPSTLEYGLRIPQMHIMAVEALSHSLVKAGYSSNFNREL